MINVPLYIIACVIAFLGGMIVGAMVRDMQWKKHIVIKPEEYVDDGKYNEPGVPAKTYSNMLRIISVDEFVATSVDGSEVSHEALIYYDESFDLVSSDDSFIYDPQKVFNKFLTHFGEKSNDPNLLYLRDIGFNTDYEIRRVHGSYEGQYKKWKKEIFQSAAIVTDDEPELPDWTHAVDGHEVDLEMTNKQMKDLLVRKKKSNEYRESSKPIPSFKRRNTVSYDIANYAEIKEGVLKAYDDLVKVISLEDFLADSNNPDAPAQRHLTYYEKDDTLVDEDGDIVDGDVKRLIHKNLGTNSDDPDRLYLRDIVSMVDCEILRIHESYPGGRYA